MRVLEIQYKDLLAATAVTLQRQCYDLGKVPNYMQLHPHL